MTVKERLIALGWEHLDGAALAKVGQVLGYDVGPNAYAKKFGRKTVFLRDCAGVFKFSVPYDRDDPRRLTASSGSRIYERWPPDPESADAIARGLVDEFYRLQNEEGQAR